MDLPLRRIDKQSQRHNCREQPVRSKNAWIWICLSLQFAKKHQTLHYRLKPMKQGQFRLANFASHFISFQTFQIDFSTVPLILFASKYFRYIFRGHNEDFTISISHYHVIEAIIKELRKEKGTSWTTLYHSALMLGVLP